MPTSDASYPRAKALVIGCGYVGSAVALELARRGHRVDGLRRTPVENPALKSAGVNSLFADITRLEDLRKVGTDYDWVVNCVAPSEGGPVSYERVYLEGMLQLVAHFKGSAIRAFVYTSSSGVYGQDDGSEVDETSPVAPQSDTGKILRQTEMVLLEAARHLNFPAIILRVSGIYGPGRTYWLKKFLSEGSDSGSAGIHYMNMIHRDDVAGAILAALEKGRAGEIYNASDDESVSQQKLFAWLSSYTGRSVNSQSAGAGAEPRRRTVTNKRISNRKLREELGYRFQFPTFREGYAAELARSV